MNRSRDRWKKLYPESDGTDETGIPASAHFAFNSGNSIDSLDESGSACRCDPSGGRQIRMTGWA